MLDVEKTRAESKLNKRKAPKGGKKALSEYARRYTEGETQLFCKVLADPDDCFLSSLEKLALKNSANDEVRSRAWSTHLLFRALAFVIEATLAVKLYT